RLAYFFFQYIQGISWEAFLLVNHEEVNDQNCTDNRFIYSYHKCFVRSVMLLILIAEETHDF
ncbi:hypothetical protein L9F63_019149, partial [Diploptera punctata]